LSQNPKLADFSTFSHGMSTVANVVNFVRPSQVYYTVCPLLLTTRRTWRRIVAPFVCDSWDLFDSRAV